MKDVGHSVVGRGTTGFSDQQVHDPVLVQIAHVQRIPVKGAGLGAEGEKDRIIEILDDDVTGIAHAVTVTVDLGRVPHGRTEVYRIDDAVPVIVRVAEISCGVRVEVLLCGIGERRAIVVDVTDPIGVGIAAALRLDGSNPDHGEQ
jgi:hypothetical protein